MALSHTNARRAALMQNEALAFDAGSGAGTDTDRTGHTNGAIKVYSGAAPGAGNAATGVLLAIIELPNPAFNTPANNPVGTLNGVPVSGSVVASGTAGYYRGVDRNGNVVQEGGVATTGAELNISGSTVLTSGGTLTINSGSLTGPA
jgi:hypothetical protein